MSGGFVMFDFINNDNPMLLIYFSMALKELNNQNKKYSD